MDLRQFDCFLAVAETLHFGRAADALHMSQSSVSEAIKALERTLGGPLFERSSRRVALTPLGETLKRGAGPAVILLKSAIDDCRRQASGKPRHLRIGFLGGGFYELYRPLVSEFKAAHPSVELEFVELTYVTHYAAVADGSVDVAFCRLPLGADGLCHGRSYCATSACCACRTTIRSLRSRCWIRKCWATSAWSAWCPAR